MECVQLPTCLLCISALQLVHDIVISYFLLSVCTSVKHDEKCTVFYGLGVERGGEEDRLSILDVGLSN